MQDQQPATFSRCRLAQPSTNPSQDRLLPGCIRSEGPSLCPHRGQTLGAVPVPLLVLPAPYSTLEVQAQIAVSGELQQVWAAGSYIHIAATSVLQLGRWGGSRERGTEKQPTDCMLLTPVQNKSFKDKKYR